MKFPTFDSFLFHSRLHQHRLDLLILSFLLFEAAVISFAGSQLIDPALLQGYTEDVWFGSDIARVLGNLTNLNSNFFRAKVHPLFPILTFPMTKLIILITHLPPIDAVRVLVATATAIWIGLMFITLRLIGCRRWDAALFSILMLSSAATIFWTVIPESFLFGSLTLLMALCFTALNQRKPLSPGWAVLVNILTLGVTTTNWLMGLAATAVSYSWKRSLQIIFSSLGIILILWRIQHRFFPSALFFIGNFSEENHYILPSTSGGPLRVFLAFVFHSMVMPAMQLLPNNHHQPDWPLLSVQLANVGSGGFWSIASVSLWTVLLLLGVWSFFATQQNLKFRIALAIGLLGQLLLYTVYGEETFLYAVHIIPFLIGMCALSSLMRIRPLALTLATALVICGGINNGIQFTQATKFLKHTGPLRQQYPQSQVEYNRLPVPSLSLEAKVHPRNLAIAPTKQPLLQ
jgi:Family of unknown function (DUF6080)